MSQSTKIKVLLMVTQGEMGGAQRYVFDLATNLNPPPSLPAPTRRRGEQSPFKIRGGEKGGYEILVVMGREKTDLKNHLEGKNIPVQLARHLKRNIHPVSDLLAVWELKKIISEFRPDIIHLNSSKAGVVGTLAAILAGNENVVFTAHGFAFLEPNNFLVNFIYFWAEKLTSIFRKKIITVSEYDREAAVKAHLCPTEKLITIHNGIALPVIASDSEAISNNHEIASALRPRNDGKITIGTIAHDYPTKDLKTLRKAVDLVKKDYANVELKIISRVPNAASTLASFDIYVCSSIKEGFPYTILEAMAAGLPIVATRVGGIPEAISDGQEGLLVPPQNPRALAAAIEKLITDRQLALSLGERAKQKVKQFSLKKMLEQTEAVYREVMS